MTPLEFVGKFPDNLYSNENCLEDIGCPKCGQRSKFQVTITTTAELTDDGTDAHCDDHDFEDNSDMRCPQCEYSATVADFTFPGLDDVIEEMKEEA